MAPASCVQCESWKGSRYACGANTLWTGQVVKLSRFSGRPGFPRGFRPRQKQAAASSARCIAYVPSSATSNEGNRGERQQQQDLVQQSTVFCKDHTRWWDNRQNLNSRAPDLRRHRESSEKALWLKTRYKPAWVADHTAPAASLLSADQLVLGSETRFTLGYAKKLCKQGQVKEAVTVLEALVVGTVPSGVDKHVLYSVLKECVAKKDLALGCQVHALALKLGFGSDMFLCNHFIRMYAAHGKLQQAMDVFRGAALPTAFMWSSIISAHAKQGHPQRAVELYRHMRATATEPDNHVFVAALHACAAAGDLRSGKQLHSQVQERGLDRDAVVGGSLVNMYCKCGSLGDARAVFDGLGEKDVVTWTAMMAGYARQEGTGQDALDLYTAMRRRDGGHAAAAAVPNAVTYVCLLQACANVGTPAALETGKQLHSQILVERGFGSHASLGGSLVNMYCKCGSLVDARAVFDGLRDKSVVTWTAMIAGYAQQEGMGQEALAMYSAMRKEQGGGTAVPDGVTFVCLLQACANVGAPALAQGRQLHSQIRERGLDGDVVVGNCLVTMYCKCGSLVDARAVFDGLRGRRTVVTWTAMIAGYANVEGMGQEALDLYRDMQQEGVGAVPNAVTFVCLLQACANVGAPALEQGKQVHALVKERGLDGDVAVGGRLVNMYCKCGSLWDARAVFDGLREKNVVTWTAMIAGYAQQEGAGQDALDLYSAMRKEGGTVAPNAVTLVCLLQACANVGVSALEKGQQLHSRVRECGLESDMVVGGSLVNMYCKCGSLADARAVFDGLREKNVVTWTGMMAGYAQREGTGQQALDLYSVMQREVVVVPNAVTFVCVLQACANVGVPALEQGKRLHSQIRERGMEGDVVVGNSLVNMYAKCGSLVDARAVFDGLGEEKNVVSWNAMICGYAQQEGMGQEALSLYGVMRRKEGGHAALPNTVTFACLLQACASVCALQHGVELHAEVRAAGLERDPLVGTALVHMYAQCGRLELARDVFDGSATRSVETWCALINGYGAHGEGGAAIQCFEEVVEQGVAPNEVTYICLLTACSRASLVDEGWRYFENMEARHGVRADERHYGCMVDLLARAGHLDRAEQMLMRMGPGGGGGGGAAAAVSWTALLSACKSHGDAARGRRCFDRLVALDPASASAYVLLGGIYADAGRWGEVAAVEAARRAAGARKKPAKACIAVNKFEVREFTVGDAERCGSSDDVVAAAAAAVRRASGRLKEGGGHVPHTGLVWRAGASERDKEAALCGHAEKLALAYGLINTPAGAPLLVTKNLRMCGDCHSSTKVMSRVERRDIVVRDGHKVHRFQNGACSCRDRP